MNDGERLTKTLLRDVGRAVCDYQLIAEGDVILAAVSGGKDSFVMLHLLRELQRRAPVRFEIVAVNLDQGHPGFPAHVLPTWMAQHGYRFVQLKEDTHAIVQEKIAPGDTPCSLCSRLRRGILYSAAVKLGCSKIALGHHRDDLIHTFLLNQFFAGTCASMPPKLTSNDGRNVVIRPLALCGEKDIARLADALAFPVIPCTLCGSQPDLQRAAMRELVDGLEARHPMVRQSLMSAMKRVRPRHLLDTSLAVTQREAETPATAQVG